MEKRKHIPYKPYLKQLARQLRNNSTLGEVLLWQELKGGAMLGLDFHRQKPLDSFIVDFYCSELNLAIEIDGDSHDYSYSEDLQRQKRLEQFGVKFLRFYDLEVKQDMANVLRAIKGFVLEFEQLDGHTPNPSQEGNKL
ncbi:very-short-patch-repair endonuclease [Pontibacter aydingkolensis]|uniref:Endonuclease domain-containing protein n=1 Tax=Pontibacter aydingkolensis TaxID=1911536 RepID=A0ABS7CTS3_9BACT|nr:endonuclease domain-containing protein [Pontibacter aydingkolensis]MBW7467260.1 endonuclease domain-containing protein [Pontibacter aydingkolensis]